MDNRTPLRTIFLYPHAVVGRVSGIARPTIGEKHRGNKPNCDTVSTLPDFIFDKSGSPVAAATLLSSAKSIR